MTNTPTGTNGTTGATETRPETDEAQAEPAGSASPGSAAGQAEAPAEETHRSGRPSEGWPAWQLLGSRLLDLVPEGLRESVAPHPGDGFAVEELVEDGFLVVRAECPGVDPEKDVDVTVGEGLLNIRVRRHDTRTSEHDGYRRSEFRYGSFTRRLPLPRGASADVVSASYRDGILEVRLPAPAPGQQARRVPVARS